MPISATDTGLSSLLDTQQSDGGWAYNTDSSWTEPTAYAILALRTAGGPQQAICRAAEWLARRQRQDGGWSPGSAVEQSTHVTSLAILGLSHLDGYEDLATRGVHWVLSQAGAETSFWSRMARFVMRTQSGPTEHTGWPWFPGASAWVIPTSLAICALLKHQEGPYAAEIAARVRDARSFLLSRRCPDHGWNHGGLFRAGETPGSYPETTGIALLALAGTAAEEIGPSLERAAQHSRAPRSSEGAYWLRLGLSVYGQRPAPSLVPYRDWTINQIALGIIAHTGEKGVHAFIDTV